MLIIYAHPNKNGHCGFVLEQIQKELDKKGQKYQLLDLYAMNYDPVLKPDEHYTSGQKKIAPENSRIQELIKNEQSFIFIYPSWWNSPPAILKGFVDRVMVAHFAFKYESELPKGLLKGKAAVFVSTGAPHLISRFYFGNQAAKFMTRDVLGFCGIKAKKFIIDRATNLNDKQKTKIIHAVNGGLNYLLNTC